MHKITRDAAVAFRDLKPFKRSNTRVNVSPCGETVTLELYGHPIARRPGPAGVGTGNGVEINTTTLPRVSDVALRRLNGLLETLNVPERVQRRHAGLYFGATPWDGGWLRVDTLDSIRDAISKSPLQVTGEPRYLRDGMFREVAVRVGPLKAYRLRGPGYRWGVDLTLAPTLRFQTTGTELESLPVLLVRVSERMRKVVGPIVVHLP